MNIGRSVSRIRSSPGVAEESASVRGFGLIARSHGIVTPRLPQLTPKPVIGVVVADKLLGLGIPLELATKAERENSEMAKRCRTVTDLCFTNGGLPCANTVEKIPHMVVAFVESYAIGRQWCGEELRIAGFNRATCDPDPAVGSFKFHAMLLPFWICD